MQTGAHAPAASTSAKPGQGRAPAADLAQTAAPAVQPGAQRAETPGDTTGPGPHAAHHLALHRLGLMYDGAWLFHDLSLTAPAGQCTVLLGASGTGKSSLLKIAAGIVRPQHGHASAADDQPLHGRIAYMAQQDLLLPWLTAQQNVTIGDRLRHTRPDTGRARRLLAQVGLAGRERAMPATLSGGMRQRTALARTLYENRPFVLMDEPFSALDALTRTRLQDLAAHLLHDRTTLLVTHDPLEACRLGHQLFVLSGHPAQLAPPIILAGAPPRAVDDPETTHAHAALLRQLAADATP